MNPCSQWLPDATGKCPHCRERLPGWATRSTARDCVAPWYEANREKLRAKGMVRKSGRTGKRGGHEDHP